MDLSIIIVNYNGGAMILDAIGSVLVTQAQTDVEVTVVDNGSSDGSLAAIRQHFGDRVRCIEMGRNAGFAAANNAGIREAKGRYVMLLNPDTVVLEGALQAMTDYMDSHPEAGACGANLYNEQMKPQFSYWMVLPGARMEWHGLWSDRWLRCRYRGSHEHNLTDEPRSVAYCMGAALMTRREVIDRVGMMDEDFFLFYEETEWCWRIRKAGYEIVNIPQAKIIHLEGQTIDKMRVRQEQMMRSRDLYLRKCCSPTERQTANLILALSSAIRVGCFALCGKRDKVRFWNYTLHHIYRP